MAWQCEGVKSLPNTIISPHSGAAFKCRSHCLSTAGKFPAARAQRHHVFQRMVSLLGLFGVFVALVSPATAQLENALPTHNDSQTTSNAQATSQAFVPSALEPLHIREIMLGEAQLASKSTFPGISLLQDSLLASRGETTAEAGTEGKAGGVQQPAAPDAASTPQPSSPQASVRGAPETFTGSIAATQRQAPSASQFAQGTTVLKGVTLAISSVIIQGVKVTQVAAFKGGSVLAVFNLTTTSAEKAKLLQDISDLAKNPEAVFDLIWEAISPTAGKLKLKLESSYNAAASKPSVALTLAFKHVVGTREIVDTVTASIPKTMVLEFKQLADFKGWLAANCHPPILKHADAFHILRLTLTSAEKQKSEVRGEEQALKWLHMVAARKDPVLPVSGELERNAIIEIPFVENLTWPLLLKLRALVDESAKGHTPISSFAGKIPGLKTERFTVPTSWFELSPEQQYELWLKGRQPGTTGVSPGQLNITGLFGPQYTAGIPQIFFYDHTGQPFGSNKQRDNVSLFGTRLTPVDKVPDYVAGQFSPALSAKIVFPGGSSAVHVISPVREWHKIEKRYLDLRAALAPKEPEKNGALLSVTINGKIYPLVAEFVEMYPTLLHLLAHLATENPAFVVNDISLNFGASVPRSVKSIFILETPEGIQPWCMFQYDISITRRNTIIIKSLLKKARQAAESPAGCNIVNAKGLRFETITAVANVTQMQPELKTENRQELNFKGSSAECKRLGAIFTDAHRRGHALALYFSATHLLKGSVEIPKFDKEGRERKPSIKTVTSRVKINEKYPDLLKDFQRPFWKYKVPTMEFPYVQSPGKPEASALPEGFIPEAWYHQAPAKVKLIWHPQFPILGGRDTFTDGTGAHVTGETVNVPLRPGTSALTGPFTVIQTWLRQHIPHLQLPVDLESMPAEDRNSLFNKIVIEVEGGERMRLIDILKPLLHTPNWKALKPEDFQVPYHLLTIPIKNMFVEGGLDFVVTTPSGGQESHTVPIRPGETWETAADNFFHRYPQFERKTTKLSLFDSDGNPITLRPDSSVYIGVKEAIQQRRKGLQITLETPFGKVTACYRLDVEKGKCLVVSMHTVFCGKIKGISDRAERWQKQCNAADMKSTSVDEVQRFMEQTLRGADLVRPVRLRDLLALMRKHVASTRPDLLAQLNLPDPAISQAEITKIKSQIEAVRAKPNKTAEDYDEIQRLRRQIKMILAKETKWAVPSALTFFYLGEKGVERDLRVPIKDPELRLSDEFWKVFHHATRQSPEAAAMDFANVYDISFRVLGMEERKEEKRRIKHKVKLEKKEEKAATQIKIKVKVEFDVDNEESSSDTGVDVTIPADFSTGLTIGGKRSIVTQLSKIYKIPRSYFTFEGYPRVVTDPAKGELPILKVALQAVCSRKDGTIGIQPSELARVLTELGGYTEKDLIFLITTSGEKLRVSIENVRQIAPDKARLFMFAWKRTAADIKAAAEAKGRERAEAIEGEKTLLFSVNVADPLNWRNLLGPWLSRTRGFGPLANTKIQLVVRNDKEKDRGNRKSKCQVSTFGELLELINHLEELLKICPGLQRATTNRQPFSFELGIKSPPPTGFRLWNRAHGDPEKNRRYLERLTVAFANVYDETKINWKFAKHSGTMTPEQIRHIRDLLQSDKPRDAALVREMLAVLGVPADDIARLTGRLSILIFHEPTDQDKVLLREGVITIDIARANGARVSRNISAKANPNRPVNIELPNGEYSLSYSLYSSTKQVSGSPCGIRTSEDFRNLTWGTALHWCNLTFNDLQGLSSPFVWIEGSQTAMYPTSQPGTPVVFFQNEMPLGFTFRRPGSPLSGIMPNDVYFNMVQQPGANVPGATYVQRMPNPGGYSETSINYFGQDPQRWGTMMEPGTGTTPRGTTAEFNVFPDPDQEESGKAFFNPLHQTVEIPGFSHLPDLHDNFNLVFNLSKPPPPQGELVYIQAPAGNGKYYYCPGITLQQFLNLKKKEEAARLCGIPIEVLDGDILVSAFSPGTTPNYAPARPAVPVILIDRMQRPHYFTAPWDDNPMKYIEQVLQGGHPEDQMAFTFAGTNHCVLTQQMLQGLGSWVELARFCSATFKGVRPTEIVGVVQSVYFLPPIKIVMPEALKTSFISSHRGATPEDIFTVEPLGFVINNLLASQQPGVTLETFLELSDGSRWNFTQIPEEWKNMPAPQIPGLMGITITIIKKPQGHYGDVDMGTLSDLLAQLNMDGSTPFSQFVTKITTDAEGPTGIKIPATNIRIGGPPPPGAARPRLDFEMFHPETLGSDGRPTNFGTTVSLSHGAVPDTLPMKNVIEMLHNPHITLHQKPRPTHSITALAGTSVPLTKTEERLDASFGEIVEWLEKALGLNNPETIHITVVVDGTAYRGVLSAAQLLGHTLGSILGLTGAVDLDDSHSIVFIFLWHQRYNISYASAIQGQPAPGYTPRKIPADQRMNFVVNGTVYDESPGSPVDFAKILNIQVPGKGQPPTDFKFNITGPSGESATQLVPADLMRLLQEVAEMHGNPGMNLVLSFLNSLKQVSRVAPGQTIRIDTQALEAPAFKHPNAAIDALLNTPVGNVPDGSYLVVFTGAGPASRRVTVPITPVDKNKTVSRLLEHLNIALQSIADIKIASKPEGRITVEDGAVDLGILGQSVKVPLRYISSTDKSSINSILRQMGQQLGRMLQEANIPHQQLTLQTTFTKHDGSTFSVETPLGPTENVEQMLSNLTLWALVPKEAQQEHIKHVSMSVQAIGSHAPMQMGSRPPSPQSPAGMMLPTEKTWGTLPGSPASNVPGFFIQGPRGERINLGDVRSQPLRVFLRNLVSPIHSWCRAFWGTQTPEGCIPKTEFPYYVVMSTELGQIPVPEGKNCLVVLRLDPNFQALIPTIRPGEFEVEYLFHEPPLQQTFKGGRKAFHSYTIELDAAKSPLRSLIEKAIGWSKVSSAQSCLVTNPRVPFSCDDPLPIDPETDTLEKVASNSRFVVVRTRSAAAEQTAAFIQKIPFLARINRIQHLGRDSQ